MRIAILGLLVLPLAACGGDSIVGVWSADGEAGTMEFRSDGTLSATAGSPPSSISGTWERVDDAHIRTTMRLEMLGQSSESTQTFEASISGNTLTIGEAGEAPQTFTRR